MLEINLSKVEADRIANIFSDLKYIPYGSDEYIIQLRSRVYRAFPKRIVDLLERQRTSKLPLPYFAINNMPIDQNISGSPDFNETGRQYKNGNLTENIICAVGSMIGEPYSIHFEGKELVNNLTPQKNTKNEYTGLGSEVELDFHIENSALSFMPGGDFSPLGLLFMGVRIDPNFVGPKTFFADARKALEKLQPKDLEILRRPNFIIHLPYRWRAALGQEMDSTGLCPLVSGPNHFPRISAVFYPGMVLPVNKRAEEAFTNFYTAIKEVSIGIHIVPGKLVYVDNRFALHSRESFKATYDVNDKPYRWVQRLFLATNLWNLRSFASNNGRVYDPSKKIEECRNDKVIEYA